MKQVHLKIILLFYYETMFALSTDSIKHISKKVGFDKNVWEKGVASMYDNTDTKWMPH